MEPGANTQLTRLFKILHATVANVEKLPYAFACKNEPSTSYLLGDLAGACLKNIFYFLPFISRIPYNFQFPNSINILMHSKL